LTWVIDSRLGEGIGETLPPREDVRVAWRWDHLQLAILHALQTTNPSVGGLDVKNPKKTPVVHETLRVIFHNFFKIKFAGIYAQ
jgi:hypothetical protein